MTLRRNRKPGRLGFSGWVIPAFGRALIRVLGGTVRVRELGKERLDDLEDRDGVAVLAFFHGRQFLLVSTFLGRRVSIMSSLSRDGELQARALSGLGYRIVRGSASRGGARGLIAMKRLMEQGYHGSFAVDGPKGPIHQVKPGAVYLAKKTGAPVLPLAASANPAFAFQKAWDRYLLPMPFSKGVVIYGEPMRLDGDLGEEAVDRDCKALQSVLEDLQVEADCAVGRV
ncbi:MAG: lysophospholipid acyltransferase family protein [Deltaproteobacteria bacterium]|nr:lysophospholipid acyltransferase family protein [Deltaproteobacteria bacterium]